MLRRIAGHLTRMKAFQEGIVIGAAVLCSFLAPKAEEKAEDLWQMVDRYLEKQIKPKEITDGQKDRPL
jgi:hypothetical protein